jgi:hypothetical protein
VTPPSIPTRGAAGRLLGDVRLPHPLAGLVLYDADRVQEAASTAEVKKLLDAQLRDPQPQGRPRPRAGVVHFRSAPTPTNSTTAYPSAWPSRTPRSSSHSSVAMSSQIRRSSRGTLASRCAERCIPVDAKQRRWSEARPAWRNDTGIRQSAAPSASNWSLGASWPSSPLADRTTCPGWPSCNNLRFLQLGAWRLARLSGSLPGGASAWCRGIHRRAVRHCGRGSRGM